MKFKFILLLVTSILVFTTTFAYIWKNLKNYEKTDNAYIRGSITNISSRIQGYVENVPAILNTYVDKDVVIVEFEKEPFKAKYDLATAELVGAKAKVDEMRALISSEKIKIDKKKLLVKLSNSNIKSAEAKLSAELSNLKLMTEEKRRMNKLYQNKTISKARLDKSYTNYERSLYKVKQLESEKEVFKISHQVMRKEINQIEIKLEKLLAEKLRMEAKKDALISNLKSAEIDLDSTTIRAPISGIIANRIVEPGVYMKKGWPLMSIVPVEDVWIIANFKETQIKNIRVGQEVEITVDAFSKINLNGKVLSISPASASSFSIIPPQNASGNFVKVVQRVPVKIVFDIPSDYIGKIVPGLSVVVKVITAAKTS